MVIDVIMKVLIGAFTAVLSLVPAYTLPASVTDAGASLGAAVSTANGIFPVATLGLCLVALIAARLFLYGWTLLVFVYDRIPFKAT